MTKPIRILVTGLGIALALVVLELTVNIGPFVNKFIPCHQNQAYSTNCYLAYDVYWLGFLIVVVVGLAAAIAYKLVTAKQKRRK